MGVKELWGILGAVREERPLSALSGRRLAVDLSGWVCEAQTAKGLAAAVGKPYLRNLFFRIHRLYSAGARLVFVIDGEATPLKWGTMATRQKARGAGQASSSSSSRQTGHRRQLDAKIRECCELLQLLGVPHLISRGEAEALCGLLSSHGLVDGVLTEDSDAFLYGARAVYRGLSTTEREGRVEVYTASDIESKIGLSRSDLVAMALVLGCDYCPQGVPGVGKETLLKLCRLYKSCDQSRDQSCDLLRKFKQWGKGDHAGDSELERKFRKKAMAVSGFPNQKIIDEYLTARDPLPSEGAITSWNMPQVKLLQCFFQRQLDWVMEYSLQKLLPLLTLWLLRAGPAPSSSSQPGTTITPTRVVRKRVQKCVQCLEVKWTGQNSLAHLEEDSTCAMACSPGQFEFTTVEVEALFRSRFPELCVAFDEEQELKKLQKKARKVKKSSKKPSSSGALNTSSDDIIASLAEIKLNRSFEDESTEQITKSDSNQAPRDDDDINTDDIAEISPPKRNCLKSLLLVQAASPESPIHSCCILEPDKHSAIRYSLSSTSSLAPLNSSFDNDAFPMHSQCASPDSILHTPPRVTPQGPASLSPMESDTSPPPLAERLKATRCLDQGKREECVPLLPLVTSSPRKRRWTSIGGDKEGVDGGRDVSFSSDDEGLFSIDTPPICRGKDSNRDEVIDLTTEMPVSSNLLEKSAIKTSGAHTAKKVLHFGSIIGQCTDCGEATVFSHSESPMRELERASQESPQCVDLTVSDDPSSDEDNIGLFDRLGLHCNHLRPAVGESTDKPSASMHTTCSTTSPCSQTAPGKCEGDPARCKCDVIRVTSAKASTDVSSLAMRRCTLINSDTNSTHAWSIISPSGGECCNEILRERNYRSESDTLQAEIHMVLPSASEGATVCLPRMEEKDKQTLNTGTCKVGAEESSSNKYTRHSVCAESDSIRASHTISVDSLQTSENTICGTHRDSSSLHSVTVTVIAPGAGEPNNCSSSVVMSGGIWWHVGSNQALQNTMSGLDSVPSLTKGHSNRSHLNDCSVASVSIKGAISTHRKFESISEVHSDISGSNGNSQQCQAGCVAKQPQMGTFETPIIID